MFSVLSSCLLCLAPLVQERKPAPAPAVEDAEGAVTLDSLIAKSNELKSFTATFEHHCEGLSSAVRGCVHYEM